MAQETGKLEFKKVDRGTSKAGKPWTKMTFVIDVTTDPKYPKKIAFDTFRGELIEFIQDTTEGTSVKVDYSVESREWQGRWFSNVNASSAEVVREGGQQYNNTPPPPAPPVDGGDLPF